MPAGLWLWGRAPPATVVTTVADHAVPITLVANGIGWPLALLAEDGTEYIP